MRRALVLAALVALPLARGDDKKKDGPFHWDPRQRPRVVAGTRTFYDYELTASYITAIGQKGQLADVSSQSLTSSSYRWIRHVLGVESGAMSEAEVKFERWRTADWSAVDSSLEGKSGSLSRARNGPIETKLDDPDGVSEAARTWLTGELFRNSGRLGWAEYVEDLLVVREPAAVTTGCEWTRDPKMVALGMLQTTDVDPQRSSVTGKLEDVHLDRGVHYGTAEVKAVIQVRKLDEREYRYTDGTLMTITWRFSGSLEPGRREDAERSLSISYEDRTSFGGALEAVKRRETTETLKCGPARK